MTKESESKSRLDEAQRQLAQDFREVFGTPQGARVWRHIRDKICFYRGQTLAPSHIRVPTGESALYHSARRDVADAILSILEYDFQHTKPTVVHTRSAVVKENAS